MALRMRTLHPATRNRDALRCDGCRTRLPCGTHRPAIFEYLKAAPDGVRARRGVLCTIAALRHQENQLLAILLKHHVLLRECTFGDAITIKCLRGIGLEAPRLTGLRPPSRRLEAGIRELRASDSLLSGRVPDQGE